MLKVGFGKADITPAFPVPLGGYELREGLSQGIHLPVFARTMIIESQQGVIVFISLELLGVDLKFTSEMRKTVATLLNIPTSNILIAATHTHSSIESFPAHMYKGLWVSSPPLGEIYRDKMKEHVLVSVKAAMQSIQAVRVYEARGQGRLGGNRRTENGIIDNEIVYLKFVSYSNRLLGTVLNYSCHPTVLNHLNLHISGDYPGWVMRELESDGSVCLFLNGAAGDISTRFQRSAATFEEVERLGQLLLEDVQRLEPFPTRIDSISIKEQLVHLVQRDRTNLETLLQVIQLGPFVFLAFPGELFAEEGLHLKSVKPGLIIIGYANDYIGYVVTDDTYGTGGYESEVTRIDLLEKHRLMSIASQLCAF